jgi:hypothetical protein
LAHAKDLRAGLTSGALPPQLKKRKQGAGGEVVSGRAKGAEKEGAAGIGQ